VVMEERERRPRRQAVREAVGALRSALAAMDERLRGALSEAFVQSLYPALAREGAIVADVGDGDDDATAEDGAPASRRQFLVAAKK